MTIVALPLNDPTAVLPAVAAQNFRQAMSTLCQGGVSGRPLGAQTGWVPSAVAAVTINSSSRVISIPPAAWILDVETPVVTGPYMVTSDATDTSKTATAPNTTLDRRDGLYITLNDDDVDHGGSKGAVFTYLAGTAATTPVLPATPARSFLLGTIFYPNANSGGAPTFTVNPVFSVASGGILPVANAATRTAVITAPYEGMGVYLMDLNVPSFYNGATWDDFYPTKSLETFSGTAYFGTYDPTKPIHHFIARKSGTSDATNGFSTATSMPAGTTAVLGVTFGMGLVVGHTIVLRTDLSSLASLIFQLRSSTSPFAAVASTGYDFTHDVAYQL